MPENSCSFATRARAADVAERRYSQHRPVSLQQDGGRV